MKEETSADTTENVSLDFLDEEPAEEKKDISVTEQKDLLDTPKESEKNPSEEFLVPPLGEEEEMNLDALEAQEEEISKEIEAQEEALDAPKSPFESFGNAILSKVDNDLFNQMSKIEKQNTILNLQLKREDLRNRIAALRAAREQARQEAEARRIAEEQKIKDMEAARQAKILEEERKLREKEMELEKVRQGKIINDYMNQMLVMNQEWIEKNAELQAQILEFREERKELIHDFEEKLNNLYTQSQETGKVAQNALETHQRIVEALNDQIEQLKQSVIDAENRLKQSQSDPDNPFAGDVPGKDAIDMAQEYAIMDITGKGKDIVAKIVNKEGTTFIVHKGSMLKGGEVVTNITETYIAFDNKGVKSYLYTGGSVLEYEPTKSFNNSDKTPEETEKQSIRGEIRNVMGAEGVNASEANSSTPSKASNNNNNNNNKKHEKASLRRSGSSAENSTSSTSDKKNDSNTKSSGGGFPSLASGMFVK